MHSRSPRPPTRPTDRRTAAHAQRGVNYVKDAAARTSAENMTDHRASATASSRSLDALRDVRRRRARAQRRHARGAAPGAAPVRRRRRRARLDVQHVALRLPSRPEQSRTAAPATVSYGTPYFQFNFAWGFSGSSFMSQSFEYGEVSELIGTKFCNDPLFQAGYDLRQLRRGPSDPPDDRRRTSARRVGSISFTDPRPQYNETVWPIKQRPDHDAAQLQQRARQRRQAASRTPRRSSVPRATWPAGRCRTTTARSSSYGFQLYDMVPGTATAAG